MCGRTRLLTSSGTASDTIDMDITAEDASLEGRQQGELNTSSKTAGIGYMAGLTNGFTMRLRQSVNEIMIADNAEILGKVDNLYVGRHGMLPEEGLALAVAEAKKYNIDIIETVFAAKPQITLPYQSLVYICHKIASIALRMGKRNLNRRMVEQKADKFTTSIAGGTKDTNREPISFHRGVPDSMHVVLLMLPL